MVTRLWRRVGVVLVVVAALLLGLAPSGLAEEPDLTGADGEDVARLAVTKPVIRKVSPKKGLITGGTRITITGDHLSGGTKVRIGGVRAKLVKVVSDKKIVVRSPLGVVGRTHVAVKTRDGLSARNRNSRFSYRLPRGRNDALFTPLPGTVVGTGVQWVTGGPDLDAPMPGVIAPWVVDIAADTTAPDVGQQFLLRPGLPVYPSGLSGQVVDAATQADGTTRITVAPTPLSDSMSDITIEYAPESAASPRAAREAEGEFNSSVGFIPPGAFLCKDKADGSGQQASFEGSVGMKVDNFVPVFTFNAAGFGHGASMEAYLSMDVTTSGKVTAGGEIKCDLAPAWSNSRRLRIPLGGGATLSMGPTASFTISGKGTWAFDTTTRITVGGKVSSNGRFEPKAVSRVIDSKSGGSATFGIELAGGVSVQVGILDRAGLEIKARVGLEGEAKASNHPTQVCLDLKLFYKTSLGAFLDLWVARWEAQAIELKVALGLYHRCAAPEEGGGAGGDPTISSFRLPAATRGITYGAPMTTGDNRPGTWAIVGGLLPAGLALDPSTGWITGVPTATVSDYRFRVQFIDGLGRSALEWVEMFVNPEPPLGSGDVQVTLTWNSAADLDLHVFDTLGEEIYFGNRIAESGGALDRDSNAGCGEVAASPAENIFWPPAGAPLGTYQAYVKVYSPCSAADLSWRLTVRVAGRLVVNQAGVGTSTLFTFANGAFARRLPDRQVPKSRLLRQEAKR